MKCAICCSSGLLDQSAISKISIMSNFLADTYDEIVYFVFEIEPLDALRHYLVQHLGKEKLRIINVNINLRSSQEVSILLNHIFMEYKLDHFFSFHDDTFFQELKSESISNILEDEPVRFFDLSDFKVAPSNIIVSPFVNFSDVIKDLSYDSAVNLSKCLSLIKTEEKKKLYIDISTLIHFDHATGIQRVVNKILGLLMKAELEYVCEVVYSYPKHLNFYRANIINGKYTVNKDEELEKAIIDFSDGDKLLFLDHYPSNAYTKNTLIKELQNRGIKSYFVVHDLLPILYPNWFVEESDNGFETWLHTVISSNGALCVSNDTKNKLMAWVRDNHLTPYPGFEAKCFHLGADFDSSSPTDESQPTIAPVLERALSLHTSFLMVGTIEPRKGHAQVIDVFDRLWNKGSGELLIIVGKAGWLSESTIERLAKHPEKNKKLFWLEGLSDGYLQHLYQSSSCLIAASEGEGFGLPLIEAAQYELPIIARDIPVFREVAGEHAYYFSDVNDATFLCEAIIDWLHLFKTDMHPKSSNMPWLTWEQSAEKFLKCLRVKQL